MSDAIRLLLMQVVRREVLPFTLRIRGLGSNMHRKVRRSSALSPEMLPSSLATELDPIL